MCQTKSVPGLPAVAACPCLQGSGEMQPSFPWPSSAHHTVFCTLHCHTLTQLCALPGRRAATPSRYTNTPWVLQPPPRRLRVTAGQLSCYTSNLSFCRISTCVLTASSKATSCFFFVQMCSKLSGSAEYTLLEQL